MKRAMLITLSVILASALSYQVLILRQPAAVAADELPTVGSYTNLKALLKKHDKQGRGWYGVAEVAVVDQSAAPTAMSADSASNKAADYSGTNTQVAGVDEADVLKTDGTYIYQAKGQSVVISKAVPAEQMEIASVVRFADESFYARELYVDDHYMVVIGERAYEQFAVPEDSPELYEKRAYMYRQMTKAIVYDIQDKSNVQQIREVEVEGSYVSSRKVGSAVYLVANKYLDVYRILHDKQRPATDAEILPVYRDSAASSSEISLAYDDIRYFPDSPESNYMMVAGFNLDHHDKPLHVASYLGAGHNIYASQEHLYTAVTVYKEVTVEQSQEGSRLNQMLTDLFVWNDVRMEQNTTVYKFKLKEGETEYVAKGDVPGTILNQFSMDEHKGHFRIATTKGDMWRNDEFTSQNNVYILDENLLMSGQIEDIAPGERIYSVRFMGDRGYMVTFKQVDPLFVIDLADPNEPKILGALKIPGYSDYLHPYDENHMIGFGKDTVETKDGVALYQGMKVAMFDVSDVSNPKEKFKEIIGGRGTDSELLYNHKALLFSKDKNLMAFPVRVLETEQSDPNDPNRLHAYGQFAFQGAYVYHVDSASGFNLRGKITHISEEEMLKAGRDWYYSDADVQRILYIGDTLYTVSQRMLQAHDLNTLQLRGSLTTAQ